MKKTLLTLLLSALLASLAFAVSVPSAAASDTPYSTEGVITYTGFSARSLNDNSGLRSLYRVDNTLVRSLVAAGHDVQYGALMGIGEYGGQTYLTWDTMTVRIENGKIVAYGQLSGEEAVQNKNCSAVVVYDSTGTYGASGKYTTVTNDYSDFAYTTIYPYANETKDNLQNAELIYRAFLIVDGNITYVDATGEVFANENAAYGVSTSLYEVCKYLVDEYVAPNGEYAYRNNVAIRKVIALCHDAVYTETFDTAVSLNAGTSLTFNNMRAGIYAMALKTDAAYSEMTDAGIYFENTDTGYNTTFSFNPSLFTEAEQATDADGYKTVTYVILPEGSATAKLTGGATTVTGVRLTLVRELPVEDTVIFTPKQDIYKANGVKNGSQQAVSYVLKDGKYYKATNYNATQCGTEEVAESALPSFCYINKGTADGGITYGANGISLRANQAIRFVINAPADGTYTIEAPCNILSNLSFTVTDLATGEEYNSGTLTGTNGGSLFSSRSVRTLATVELKEGENRLELSVNSGTMLCTSQMAFVRKSYTVTYQSDTTIYSVQKVYAAGDRGVIPCAFGVPSGSAVAEWVADDYNGNTVLTAKIGKIYTVTFYESDGVTKISTQEIVAGGTATHPDMDNLSDFGGWAKLGTTEVIDLTKITEDCSVYLLPRTELLKRAITIGAADFKGEISYAAVTDGAYSAGTVYYTKNGDVYTAASVTEETFVTDGTLYTATYTAAEDSPYTLAGNALYVPATDATKAAVVLPTGTANSASFKVTVPVSGIYAVEIDFNTANKLFVKDFTLTVNGDINFPSAGRITSGTTSTAYSGNAYGLLPTAENDGAYIIAYVHLNAGTNTVAVDSGSQTAGTGFAFGGISFTMVQEIGANDVVNTVRQKVQLGTKIYDSKSFGTVTLKAGKYRVFTLSTTSGQHYGLKLTDNADAANTKYYVWSESGRNDVLIPDGKTIWNGSNDNVGGASETGYIARLATAIGESDASAFATAMENAGEIQLPSVLSDTITIDKDGTYKLEGFVFSGNYTITGRTILIPEVGETHTVTFIGEDGKLLRRETVAHGGTATAPDLSGELYFRGWNGDCENVTEDRVIVAKYNKTYSVTYKDESGNLLATEDVGAGSAANGLYVANFLFFDGYYDENGNRTDLHAVARDMTVTVKIISTVLTVTPDSGMTAVGSAALVTPAAGNTENQRSTIVIPNGDEDYNAGLKSYALITVNASVSGVYDMTLLYNSQGARVSYFNVANITNPDDVYGKYASSVRLNDGKTNYRNDDANDAFIVSDKTDGTTNQTENRAGSVYLYRGVNRLAVYVDSDGASTTSKVGVAEMTFTLKQAASNTAVTVLAGTDYVKGGTTDSTENGQLSATAGYWFTNANSNPSYMRITNYGTNSVYFRQSGFHADYLITIPESGNYNLSAMIGSNSNSGAGAYFKLYNYTQNTDGTYTIVSDDPTTDYKTGSFHNAAILRYNHSFGNGYHDFGTQYIEKGSYIIRFVSDGFVNLSSFRLDRTEDRTLDLEGTYHTVTYMDGNTVLGYESVLDGHAAIGIDGIENWNLDISSVTEDMTVSAIRTYTVKFVDYDGRVIKTLAVRSGNTVTAPEAPTREGYAFAGWSYDLTQPVTGNMIVRALYTALATHTVTFLKNDGTTLATREIYDGGVLVDIPEAPAVAGMHFCGWNRDFTEAVTADITVTPIYKAATQTVPVTSDTEIVLSVEDGAIVFRPASDYSSLTGAKNSVYFDLAKLIARNYNSGNNYIVIPVNAEVAGLYSVSALINSRNGGIRAVGVRNLTQNSDPSGKYYNANMTETYLGQVLSAARYNNQLNYADSSLDGNVVYGTGKTAQEWRSGYVYLCEGVNYVKYIVDENNATVGGLAVSEFTFSLEIAADFGQKDVLFAGDGTGNPEQVAGNPTPMGQINGHTCNLDRTVTVSVSGYYDLYTLTHMHANIGASYFTYTLTDANGRVVGTYTLTNDGSRNSTLAGNITFGGIVPAKVDRIYLPAGEYTLNVRGTLAQGSDTLMKYGYSFLSFVKEAYTVTFYDYDGVTVLGTQVVGRGESATAPDLSEHKFAPYFTGWSRSFSAVTGDISVTPCFSNLHTVRFVVNGNVVKTELVESGKGATAPALEDSEVYYFLGWDVDYSCVTGDLTVTARLAERQYEVKADSDAVSGVGTTDIAATDTTFFSYVIPAGQTAGSYLTVTVNADVTGYYTVYLLSNGGNKLINYIKVQNADENAGDFGKMYGISRYPANASLDVITENGAVSKEDVYRSAAVVYLTEGENTLTVRIDSANPLAVAGLRIVLNAPTADGVTVTSYGSVKKDEIPASGDGKYFTANNTAGNATPSYYYTQTMTLNGDAQAVFRKSGGYIHIENNANYRIVGLASGSDSMTTGMKVTFINAYDESDTYVYTITGVFSPMRPKDGVAATAYAADFCEFGEVSLPAGDYNLKLDSLGAFFSWESFSLIPDGPSKTLLDTAAASASLSGGAAMAADGKTALLTDADDSVTFPVYAYHSGLYYVTLLADTEAVSGIQLDATVNGTSYRSILPAFGTADGAYTVGDHVAFGRTTVYEVELKKGDNTITLSGASGAIGVRALRLQLKDSLLPNAVSAMTVGAADVKSTTGTVNDGYIRLSSAAANLTQTMVYEINITEPGSYYFTPEITADRGAVMYYTLKDADGNLLKDTFYAFSYDHKTKSSVNFDMLNFPTAGTYTLEMTYRKSIPYGEESQIVNATVTADFYGFRLYGITENISVVGAAGTSLNGFETVVPDGTTFTYSLHIPHNASFIPVIIGRAEEGTTVTLHITGNGTAVSPYDYAYRSLFTAVTLAEEPADITAYYVHNPATGLYEAAAAYSVDTVYYEKTGTLQPTDETVMISGIGTYTKNNKGDIVNLLGDDYTVTVTVTGGTLYLTDIRLTYSGDYARIIDLSDKTVNGNYRISVNSDNHYGSGNMQGISDADRQRLLVEKILGEKAAAATAGTALTASFFLGDFTTTRLGAQNTPTSGIYHYSTAYEVEYLFRALAENDLPMFVTHSGHDYKSSEEWYALFGYEKNYAVKIGDTLYICADFFYNQADTKSHESNEAVGDIPDSFYNACLAQLNGDDVNSAVLMVHYSALDRGATMPNLIDLAKHEKISGAFGGHTHFNINTRETGVSGINMIGGKPFYQTAHFAHVAGNKTYEGYGYTMSPFVPMTRDGAYLYLDGVTVSNTAARQLSDSDKLYTTPYVNGTAATLDGTYYRFAYMADGTVLYKFFDAAYTGCYVLRDGNFYAADLTGATAVTVENPVTAANWDASGTPWSIRIVERTKNTTSDELVTYFVIPEYSYPQFRQDRLVVNPDGMYGFTDRTYGVLYSGNGEG